MIDNSEMTGQLLGSLAYRDSLSGAKSKGPIRIEERKEVVNKDQLIPQTASSLDDIFNRLEEEARFRGTLSIFEILNILNLKGTAIAAALLSAPFLQPIPLIGLSTPLGLAIALAAIAIFLNRPIWVPAMIGRRRVPDSFILVNTGFIKLLGSKLKRFLQPPAKPDETSSISTAFIHQRWLSIVLFLHALLLSLPLPIPFSNTFPAWACMLASLAMAFPESHRLRWATAIITVANAAFWISLSIGARAAIPTLVETWQKHFASP